MNLEFSREKIEKYMENNLNNSHPILKAYKSGKLIIFVGAGMSVHLGIPSWREFALRFLETIYNYNGTTFMNYKTKESLKNEDTIKLLSICKQISNRNLSKNQMNEYYSKWFDVLKIEKKHKNNLYEKLYQLDAIFITTNYDNALDIIAENYNSTQSSIDINNPNTTQKATKNVYFNIEELEKGILIPKSVIHIHGSIKEEDSMIVSYEDYIRIYGRNNDNSFKEIRDKYSEFLTEIFAKDKVVLFIGYGLEEIQILQYLFEGEYKNNSIQSSQRYLILPCFSDDFHKINYFSDYYKNVFHVNIMPCDMSGKGYDILEDVIDRLIELSKLDYYENPKIDEYKAGLRAIEEM